MGGSLSTNATQPQGYIAKSKCWGIMIPKSKINKRSNSKKYQTDIDVHQVSNHTFHKY
jgi:hypothetical protein